ARRRDDARRARQLGRGEGEVAAVRDDLCAVTEEDLAAFSNRGSVNRAAKEVADDKLTCRLAEAGDGAVHAEWSDGWKIDIPGGKTLRESPWRWLGRGTVRHTAR